MINLQNSFMHMQMVKETHTRGLILFESLPSLFMASRIQARSTTAGTPVKSCQEKRLFKDDENFITTTL